MPTYNVLVGVADLVEADSPQDAIAVLSRQLTAAGFDTYGGGTSLLPHAFESGVVDRRPRTNRKVGQR